MKYMKILVIATLAGWGITEHQSATFWRKSSEQWKDIAVQRRVLLKQAVESLEMANNDNMKAISLIDRAGTELRRCRETRRAE